MVKNCPTLAEDIQKIFDVYWIVSKGEEKRDEWPVELSTRFTAKNPMELSFVQPDMPSISAFISVKINVT